MLRNNRVSIDGVLLQTQQTNFAILIHILFQKISWHNGANGESNSKELAGRLWKHLQESKDPQKQRNPEDKEDKTQGENPKNLRREPREGT